MAITRGLGKTGPELGNGEDLEGALDCREDVAANLLKGSGVALAESYIALQEYKLRIELNGGRIARALNRLGLAMPKGLKSDLATARAQVNHALTMRISVEEIRQHLAASASDATDHEEPGSAQ
jgi:hypothetical protein